MPNRDAVWLELAGKQRPAVVIEVESDLVRVAYGTSQKRPNFDCAVVHPDTRQGRRFPLSELTRFYGDNTEWEEADKLQRGKGQCSIELFLEIRRLVELYDAKAGAEQE